MNLTHKTTIKNLLKKYGVKPAKYLGQHFILSKKALSLILAAAEIKKNDTVIEIGPGLGTLTRELAKTGAKIVAIEKDPMMINILGETLADYKNIKIIQADTRNLWISEIYKFGDKYKIVANLPYNVATFLIHQWLELKNPPQSMVLMVQKEVARRIRAAPPRSNLLAISVQFYADVEIVDYVPKEMFWPKPKVDAAIIKIIPRKIPVMKTTEDRRLFFKVVKAGFSQPRKQLIGNLAKKLSAQGGSASGGNIPKEKLLEIFKNLNIPERVRAENLTLEQWVSLIISFHLNYPEKITD